MKRISVAVNRRCCSCCRPASSRGRRSSPRASAQLDHRPADRHPTSFEPDVVARRPRGRVHLGARRRLEDVCRGSPSGTAPAAPRELSAAGPSLAGAFWSADGRALMVPKDGDLWRVPVDGSAAVRGVDDAGRRNRASCRRRTARASRSCDLRRQAGRRRRGRAAAAEGLARGAAGELVVRSLADGRETVVLRADGRAIGGVSWSPDGQTHRLQRPRPRDPARADAGVLGLEDHLHDHRERARRDERRACGGRRRRRGCGMRGGFGGRRWLDARHFLVDRTSSDFKRRTTSLVDIAGGEPKVLHEDVEEKFWSITGDAGADAQPSPDGKWIAFLSDRDGWDHIYVMPAGGRRTASADHQRASSRRGGRSGRPTARASRSTRTSRTATARATLRRDDRRRSGARDDRAGHDRPRHQHRAAVVARRHAPRLSAHRSAEFRRPLRRRRRAGAKPTRLTDSMPATIDRSRVRRAGSRCTTPGRTASRCRRGCSCRRISIAPRSIRRSSGFTATA